MSHYNNSATPEPPLVCSLSSHPINRQLLVAKIKSFAPLSCQLGLLTLATWAVTYWVMNIGHLAPQSYNSPIIASQLILRLFTDPVFLIITITLIATRRHQLWNDWDSFDFGKQVRLFVVFTSAIAAWSFSTYDYNLYFDQAHYADRMILIALVPLIWYRPIFLLPFVLELVAIIWQFDYPLVSQYPWTEARLIVAVLTLSLATFLIHAITGSRNTAHYIFMLICLIAAIYWWGGFNKIRMGWLSHGHMYLMTLSAHANGWLGHMDTDTVVAYAKLFEPLDWLMMTATVLVEVVIIAALWRRTTVLLSLIGWIVFHLVVFATTGMFFWKWIVMESALLIWFLRSSQLKQLPIYTPNHFIISVILIATGIIWTRPTNLSWFDTPLCYTYRFEAVSKDGTKYPLPTATFTPYADTFTLGIFTYLYPNPQITHIWGVTQNLPHATSLAQISDPQKALDFEDKHGTVAYSPQRAEYKAAQMDDFIRHFFANLNSRNSKSTWLSWAQAPRHLWNSSKHPIFNGQNMIVQVNVYHVTTFFDGRTYDTIRKSLIRTIMIPSPQDIPTTEHVAAPPEQKRDNHENPDPVDR